MHQAELEVIQNFSDGYLNIEKRFQKKHNYPPKAKFHNQTEFKHYTIVDQKKLVFKNGAQPFFIDEKYVNEYYRTETSGNKYNVLEYQDEIYYIEYLYNALFVYISFDAGSSWYFYPIDTDRFIYSYSEINTQGEVSFLTYDVKSKKRGQVFYKFEEVKN